MAKPNDTNKTRAKETKKAAPLKIELFGGDTVGFCDPETGECTVPNPVGTANATDEQRKKPVSDERASDRSELSID